MTPFDMILQCEMCSDYRQYQATVADLENICRHIKRLVLSLSEKARNENKDIPHSCGIRPLDVDAAHPHFMCGQCHKAGNWLTLAEDDLKHLLIKAACLLQAMKAPEVYREILHLLQGRYPVTYRDFQKEMDRIEKNRRKT